MNEKWKIDEKLVILKNLYKIIGVQLYETIIMYQFHICGLYNSLYFKGPNQLWVISKRIQSEGNINCYYFWYYMYFQFWYKVHTPYHGNTLHVYIQWKNIKVCGSYAFR